LARRWATAVWTATALALSSTPAAPAQQNSQDAAASDIAPRTIESLLKRISAAGQRALWIHPAALPSVDAPAPAVNLDPKTPGHANEAVSRCAEVAGLDILTLADRIAVYPRGRAPAALMVIAAQRPDAPLPPPVPATPSYPARPHRDFDLVDVSVDHACQSLAESFNVTVSITDSLRNSQTLIRIVGRELSIADALDQLTAQLHARHRWNHERAVVAETLPELGGIPPPERSHAARIDVDWALDGQEMTWREFAAAAERWADIRLVAPDDWTGRSIGRLRAAGAAADIATARALWDSPQVEAEPIRADPPRPSVPNR